MLISLRASRWFGVALVCLLWLTSGISAQPDEVDAAKPATPQLQESAKDELKKHPDPYNFGPLGCGGWIRGKRLIVEFVHDDGPAHGLLQEWDEIYKANGKFFSTPPHLSLARKIDDIEGSEDPDQKLVLDVQRGEETLTLEIDLPRIGSYSKDYPDADPKLEKITEAALKKLAAYQQQNGSWIRSRAVYAHSVPISATAGLALLATGDKAYLDQCEALAKWIKEAMTLMPAAKAMEASDESKKENEKKDAEGKDSDKEKKEARPNSNRETWSWCMAAIFLAEYYLATEDKEIAETLKLCADGIIACQEKSGGWAHGPGGPNELGYQEICVTTYYSLIALGLLKSCEVTIDENVIKQGMDYLEGTQGRKGGIGYSHIKPADIEGTYGTAEAGRTAGCIVAYDLFGQRKDVVKSMMKYYRSKVIESHEGHGSQAMHLLWATVAGYRFHKSSYSRLMKHQKHRLTMMRRPGGAFTAQPTEDTLKIRLNADRMYGEVWNTSMTLLRLQVAKGHLKIFGGDPTTRRKKEEKKESAPRSHEDHGERK